MEYMSAREAAALWQMDISQVGKLARAGKLAGARQIGRRWMIPQGAARPMDGRTREARVQGGAVFRYPCYSDPNPNAYQPPLTEQEQRLQQAARLLNALRFEESYALLGNLAEEGESVPLRLAAFVCLILAEIETERTEDAAKHIQRLYRLYAEDFPHRQDMLLLLYRLETALGTYKPRTADFRTATGAEYHGTAQSALQVLSAYAVLQSGVHQMSWNLTLYNACCETMERNGQYADAQEMSIHLALLCSIQDRPEAARYHARRVLRLATEHELYFAAATNYTYCGNLYDPILDEFPPSLGELLRRESKRIHARYAKLSETVAVSTLHVKLTGRDYQLLLYALLDYPNKKVGALMNRSEATVSNLYGELCRQLGLKGKAELKQMAAAAAVEGRLP